MTGILPRMIIADLAGSEAIQPAHLAEAFLRFHLLFALSLTYLVLRIIILST